MFLQSAWLTQTTSMWPTTAVGTVVSQTGDWSGAKSERQKENVDFSASGSNSIVEAGSNSAVDSFKTGSNNAVEIDNNSNLFDGSVVNV